MDLYLIQAADTQQQHQQHSTCSYTLFPTVHQHSTPHGQWWLHNYLHPPASQNHLCSLVMVQCNRQWTYDLFISSCIPCDRWQIIPTSSGCLQSVTPMPPWVQFNRFGSVPEHWRLSRWMGVNEPPPPKNTLVIISGSTMCECFIHIITMIITPSCIIIITVDQDIFASKIFCL